MPRAVLRLLALLALLAPFVLLPALVAAQTATETPPPTPVPVGGGRTSPSPFPSVLHTPAPSVEPPEIRAAAAVLADLDTGQVLYAKEPDARRPVASLTKIMTALLVLERAGADEVVTVSESAAGANRSAGMSRLGLLPGERIRVGQLVYALMLQSANDAALALAEHVAGTVEGFVKEMNRRAGRLGLADTRFASPNGLDYTGYSSAADLARLTRAAFEHPLFGEVVATRSHEVPPPLPGGVPRIVQNRNVLLWLYPGATGVKTGYTSAAGFCVVAAAERDGVRLVAVVLGEPGEPFSDAAALLDHGFTAFERRTLVEDGEALGTVPIGGKRVEVRAGGSVSGLVHVAAEARRVATVDPGVAFPPGLGEVVGELVVDVPGWGRVGRVPLVVTDVPGPPAPEVPGPWWWRAAAAVLDAVAGLLESLIG